MAIRIPDLGTGSGAVGDGDNELEIRQDYNHNFTDQTNAASRLVGPLPGNLMEVGAFGWGVDIPIPDFSKITKPGVYSGIGAAGINYPTDTAKYTNTLALVRDSMISTISFGIGEAVITTINVLSSTITSKARVLTEKSPFVYALTTALGANVAIDSNGAFLRSTSSERYKDILAPLELDDAKYAAAMSLKPIVYRSTADADNPLHHFYSFSAEELGAYDPAFTLWRYTETVTDTEGNVTEQPLAERQAEGININALLAMNHAIAIKQDKMIKAQADAIATLTQRIEILEAK